MAQAQAPAAAGLSADPGHESVAGVCTGCHHVNMITRSSGYSSEGWKELVGTMIDFSASPETSDEIVQYLARHFPPNAKSAAMTR